MDDSGGAHERVFANTYVNMAEIDIVGFDYDYTLVTYRTELLDLIYDMALKRLVLDRQYPLDLLDAGFKFDPRFSIRGTQKQVCRQEGTLSLGSRKFLVFTLRCAPVRSIDKL